MRQSRLTSVPLVPFCHSIYEGCADFCRSTFAYPTFADRVLPILTFAYMIFAYQTFAYQDFCRSDFSRSWLMPITTYADRQKKHPYWTYAHWHNCLSDFRRSDVCRSRRMPIDTFADRDFCRSPIKMVLIWAHNAIKSLGKKSLKFFVFELLFIVQGNILSSEI